MANYAQYGKRLSQLCIVLVCLFLIAYSAVVDKSRVFRSSIVFVTRNSPSTCYYDAQGNLVGVMCDMAKLFVKRTDPSAKVSFLLVENAADAIKLLDEKADIAMDYFPVDFYADMRLTIPYRTMQFGLVFNHQINKRPDNVYRLDDKNIAVSSQFTGVDFLTHVRRNSPRVNIHLVRDATTESLIASIAHGKTDFTLAYQHDFLLYKNRHPHISIANVLQGSQPVAWVVARRVSFLKQLNQFILSIQKDGTINSIFDKYYGGLDRLNQQDVTHFLDMSKTLLPRYVNFFKRAQNITNIDWQLLAAVSYQESHWDTYNTSPTNVRGLMMLTEDTANLMGVSDRLDPQQSIPAGAKYLAKLKQDIPESIVEPDRTYFALAAYNLGMSHVIDARALSSQLGFNPNNWIGLRQALLLLNQPRYRHKLASGPANGIAAVIFVESIRNYFYLLQHNYHQ